MAAHFARQPWLRRLFNLRRLTLASLCLGAGLLLLTGRQLRTELDVNVAALVATRAITNQDPDSAPAQLRQARALLHGALLQTPERESLWRLLGAVSLTQGAAARAVGEFNRTADPLPFLFQNVNTLFKDQKYGRIPPWLAVTEAFDGPETAAWYRKVAGRYLDRGITDRALRMYDVAARLQPTLSDVWYEMGQAYLRQRSFARAIETWEHGITLGDGEAVGVSDFYYLIGRVRQSRLTPPDLDGAWQAYAAAVQKDAFGAQSGQRILTFFYRGELLAQRAQWVDAIGEYRRALALDERHYATLVSLGRAHQALGQLADAVQSWEAALAVDPAQADAPLALAQFHAGQGDTAAACALLRRALPQLDAPTAAQQLLTDYGCPTPAP